MKSIPLIHKAPIWVGIFFVSLWNIQAQNKRLKQENLNLKKVAIR